MFRLPRRFAAVPLVALGLAAGAAIAQSASMAADYASAKVFVGDLNLSSASGAHAALARIVKVADSVCGYRPLPIDLDGGAQYRSCMKNTVDGAVAQLHQPMVTALNDSQTRTQVASNH